MAAENFKVKKGLEVGTGITANSDGVNVTGIITATQFKGDGSGLTGVVGSGSGVVVKDEGSAVGTAGTINFVGSGVAATLNAGTATVTISSGGLNDVADDSTPQLGGNLDLDGKFITGSGNIDITGSLDVSGIATVGTLKGAIEATTASFSGAIDANGDLDVDGQTNLDDVRISGVTTMTGTLQGNIGSFTGAVSGTTGTFSGNISGPQLNISAGSGNDGIILLNSGGGQNNDFTRFIQVVSDDTFKIENKASGSYESLFEGKGGAEVKLYFAGNQKLTTTINGIEVPDLNATGVGTFGRLETSGVVLGTNNNTFAAKFIDDAVANFGTDNDLKISHDDTHARITNTKGDIVVSGIISAISDVKVGSAITMDPTSGIITATKFVGDGSGLTGITASGSGIIVKHDGSTVGTAGTINFSTNLDVTPISAGIVTVTASGGGGDKIEEGDTKVETIDSGDAADAYVTTEVNGTEEIRTIGGQTTIKYLRVGSNWNMANSTGSGIALNFSNNHDLISSSGTNGLDLRSNTSIELTQNGSPNHKYASFSNSSGIFRTTNTERFRYDASGIQVGQDAVSVGATITIGGNATFAGIVTATTFSGALASSNLTGALPAISGANLTSLNASNLGSGEIPNGRFPATLPAVSGANLTNVVAQTVTFTANNDNLVYRVPFASANSGSTALYSDGDITYNPNSGTLSATVFSGSGASLTNLPAGQLSGALPAISGASLTNLPAPTPTNSDIQVVYAVTANGASAYRFDGNGVVNTANNPDLYLIRGQKYRFINNSGGSHPFQIRVSNGGSAYNTGVTNNGASSGNIDFAPTFDSPKQLVYQCTSHGGMVGNIYLRGASGQNDNVGFTTFSNKIEVKSSTNTAATFKGSGGAGFINITDADDGTLAFLGVDGGEFKVQTSGNSYSDKVIIKQDGSSYFTGRHYLARTGQAASAQSNMRETFFQNIGTSSNHTFQTGNSYAGGLVYVVCSRFANANYQTTKIFAIAIRSTNNAQISQVDLANGTGAVSGQSGSHSFSVSGASKGITVTNNDSTYSMNCFVTFDITGYTA